MCFLHSVRNMFKLYILVYLSILQITVQFVGLLYKPAKGGLSSGFCESVQVPSSLLMSNMHNRTRKLREKPVLYKRCLQTTAKNKDAPTTSAKPDKIMTRKNLTLNDWLTVFAYINTHPNQSQAEIVAHFEKELTGALAFSQSAL
jgi:hypothetical protein